MELATYIGISITEFWEITPYELSMALKGYNNRIKDELEIKRGLLTIQAYQIAGWVWKRPTKTELEKIIGGEKKKKTMTDDEMLAQVKALNTLFGGEVKENGTEE